MSASALYLLAVLTPYATFAILVAPLIFERPLAALTLAAAVASVLVPLPVRWVSAVATTCAAAILIAGGSGIAFIVAAGIIGVAYLGGARMLSALGIRERLSSGEHVTHAVVLGLGAISLIVLGLAVLGLLALPAVLLVVLAVGALGWTERRSLASHILEAVTVLGVRRRSRLAGLLAFVLLVALIETVAPEVQFDALSYHLGLPREYLAAGGLVDRPEQPQSYYYLGAEMNFVAAMLFGGQTAAKLISLMQVALGALAAFSFTSAMFSRRAALIASAILLATPLLLWEATTTYVDGIATTCGLLAATAAIRAARESNGRLAALAGVAAGVGLSVKLTLILMVVPIVVVLLATGAGVFLRRARTLGVPFAGAAAIVLAPWPLLRFAQTGNPVFPLLNGVFHSPQWSPVNESFGLERFGAGVPGVLAPLVASYDASRYVDGLVGPVIGVALLVAPLAFGLRSSGPTRSLLAIGLGTVVLWMATFQYLRYMLPAVAPLSIAAGAYLDDATARATGWSGAVARFTPFVVAAAGVVLWLGTYLSVVPQVVPYPVAFGVETKSAYLSSALVTYPPLQELARMDGPNARVLIASCASGADDENRLYAPGRVETCESPWLRSLYAIGDTETASAALRDRGITHVLISLRGVTKEMRASAVLSEGFLSRYAHLDFEDAQTRLYRLDMSR